jgi:hypothetical protein
MSDARMSDEEESRMVEITMIGVSLGVHTCMAGGQSRTCTAVNNTVNPYRSAPCKTPPPVALSEAQPYEGTYGVDKGFLWLAQCQSSNRAVAHYFSRK